MFQQALLGFLVGDDPHALDTLRTEVRDLLPLTLRPAPVGAGTGA
ncbi:hypothetical protein [Pseudonocardia sp. ICBG1293]|nr:hypothetical protein [Pseudonocardia sp. ICBG1293]